MLTFAPIRPIAFLTPTTLRPTMGSWPCTTTRVDSFQNTIIWQWGKFTAGLNIIRTSPDHGTGYDIAGKNKAQESSFRQAIYACYDIVKKRQEWTELNNNPLPNTKKQDLNTNILAILDRQIFI